MFKLMSGNDISNVVGSRFVILMQSDTTEKKNMHLKFPTVALKTVIIDIIVLNRATIKLVIADILETWNNSIITHHNSGCFLEQ